MKETMLSKQGAVGLAGIQVGLPLKLIVIEYNNKYYEMVNLEIKSKDGQCTNIEGCLSIPGINHKVQRAKNIEVEYQDRDGNVMYDEVGGQLAIIIQHEYEHTIGGLYIDNIPKNKIAKVMKKYKG